MSVADFVSEAVEDEALQGALGARGIGYSAMRSSVSGYRAELPLGLGLGKEVLLVSSPVFARGGPRALADALLSAAQSHGATVRCEAEVAAIPTWGGSVVAVVLVSGEEIEARIVASSADPKQTLLRLLDPAEVGPTLGWRAENIRAPGVVANVTLLLDGLPGVRG